MAVIQLIRELCQRPDAACHAQARLRIFSTAQDVERWLELYRGSFDGQRPQPRPWTASDFQREISDRAWWTPSRTWFAEVLDESSAETVTAGTITRADRGAGPVRQAAVHWLMVAPRRRRRGIARLLLGALERQAWDEGLRSVVAETHSDWTSAVEFYRSCGYVVATSRRRREHDAHGPKSAQAKARGVR